MRTGSPPRFWPPHSGARCLTKWFKSQGVPAIKRCYWLVFDRGEADLCMRDPGFDVDLYVSAPVRVLAEIRLGHDTIRAASRAERLAFEGTRKDIARFKDWFALSLFADAGRRPPGRTTSRDGRLTRTSETVPPGSPIQ